MIAARRQSLLLLIVALRGESNAPAAAAGTVL
jgi:hypothetical protein